MYACATLKWYRGSPRLFAAASTSLMDADDEQREDKWVNLLTTDLAAMNSVIFPSLSVLSSKHHLKPTVLHLSGTLSAIEKVPVFMFLSNSDRRACSQPFR